MVEIQECTKFIDVSLPAKKNVQKCHHQLLWLPSISRWSMAFARSLSTKTAEKKVFLKKMTQQNLAPCFRGTGHVQFFLLRKL